MVRAAMLRRLRRLAITSLLALCCLVAAPLAATAQQSPFEGLPPATPPDQKTVTSNPSSATTDSGLDTWQAALIVLGGVALLGGIGLAIAKDARERAPVDVYGAAAEQHDADAHKHGRKAKVRQRQKQKAVRAARRRNR